MTTSFKLTIKDLRRIAKLEYFEQYKELDKIKFEELSLAQQVDFIRWLAFDVDEIRAYKIKLYENLVHDVMIAWKITNYSCKYVAEHRDSICAWCILNKKGELECLPAE